MKPQFSLRHARGGYRTATLGALLLAASALSLAAAPASRAAQPAPAPRFSQVRTVNLHAEFERLAGQVTTGPEMGIVRPRGYKPARGSAAIGPAVTVQGGSAAAGTCTEPDCNLVWHGGTVEHHPKVYVVFWGPGWNSNAGEQAAANYLLSFYQGLGGSQDSWSTITSQYTDNSGGPSFSGTVFGGSLLDTAAPPATVTDANLAAEAASAADAFGIPNASDDQVVVASQFGTCFNDGFAGTCTPQQNWAYCAWHGATTFRAGSGAVSFTNLPYQPDAGSNCGENWINSGSSGIYEGFSTVGGHEYAEAVTDPFPASGWVDTGDNVSGGEIGDKCAWGGSGWGSADPAGIVTLSTGAFAMQSLWDNSSGSCVMSNAAPPPPAATSVTPGLQGGGKSGMSISVLAGATVWGSGVLAGGNAASATGTATYDVYSDSACTALVSGGSAEPVTMPGYLPLSQPVTFSTPGTYYWKVSYSGDSKNVASVSTCGPSGAVETVQAPPPPPSPTGISLSLSGGGKSGATTLTVPAGTALTGHVLLSGATIATATGKVRYYLFAGGSCSSLAGWSKEMVVTVTKGTAPPPKPVILIKPGTYIWQAVYTGDSTHQSAVVACGTVKVTVTRAPVIDTKASALAKTAASASISTTGTRDLLVAYVAGKGPRGKAQTAAVTAAGLKWTLVARSDTGRGDAEVWVARAAGKLSRLKVTVKAKYAGWPVAITVAGYLNSPGIGRHATAHSAKGAPAGSLTTTAANSWVFAAGDDWARAASRTTGSGQRLVHQVTDSFGDTYWVQSTSTVTPKSGTKVRLNDTRPAADPYNLVLVEIR